jgi:hypothetical protein
MIVNFNRFTSKESACQAICHLHGSEVQGQTIKCSWGRDEQINDQNNGAAYGNGNMNNQNYNNNNQYDSVCLKKKRKMNLFIRFSILRIHTTVHQ